ncbi:MAG: hypothetical protein ACLTTW_11355, partial [Coprobacter sp.]
NGKPTITRVSESEKPVQQPLKKREATIVRVSESEKPVQQPLKNGKPTISRVTSAEQYIGMPTTTIDFSAGTAEIAILVDGDMSRTNVFTKIAIRQSLKISISELQRN